MVELIGYHGTIREKADNIIKEDRYRLSDKPTEWLGRGVYFFKDRVWAKRWSDSASERWGGEPAVLRSLIRCKKEEFFDLDSIDNRNEMESLLKKFAIARSLIGGAPNFKDVREVRRFCCNL